VIFFEINKNKKTINALNFYIKKKETIKMRTLTKYDKKQEKKYNFKFATLKLMEKQFSKSDLKEFITNISKDPEYNNRIVFDLYKNKFNELAMQILNTNLRIIINRNQLCILTTINKEEAIIQAYVK
jgi:hypothetical protein